MINNLSFSLFTTCLKYINIVNANFPLTACSHGWYGQDCEQRCIGYCKRNTFCNHMTGQCEKGCDVGWSGSFCLYQMVWLISMSISFNQQYENKGSLFY